MVGFIKLISPILEVLRYHCRNLAEVMGYGFDSYALIIKAFKLYFSYYKYLLPFGFSYLFSLLWILLAIVFIFIFPGLFLSRKLGKKTPSPFLFIDLGIYIFVAHVFITVAYFILGISINVNFATIVIGLSLVIFDFIVLKSFFNNWWKFAKESSSLWQSKFKSVFAFIKSRYFLNYKNARKDIFILIFFILFCMMQNFPGIISGVQPDGSIQHFASVVSENIVHTNYTAAATWGLPIISPWFEGAKISYNYFAFLVPAFLVKIHLVDNTINALMSIWWSMCAFGLLCFVFSVGYEITRNIFVSIIASCSVMYIATLSLIFEAIFRVPPFIIGERSSAIFGWELAGNAFSGFPSIYGYFLVQAVLMFFLLFWKKIDIKFNLSMLTFAFICMIYGKGSCFIPYFGSFFIFVLYLYYIRHELKHKLLFAFLAVAGAAGVILFIHKFLNFYMSGSVVGFNNFMSCIKQLYNNVSIIPDRAYKLLNLDRVCPYDKDIFFVRYIFVVGWVVVFLFGFFGAKLAGLWYIALKSLRNHSLQGFYWFVLIAILFSVAVFLTFDISQSADDLAWLYPAWLLANQFTIFALFYFWKKPPMFSKWKVVVIFLVFVLGVQVAHSVNNNYRTWGSKLYANKDTVELIQVLKQKEGMVFVYPSETNPMNTMHLSHLIIGQHALKRQLACAASHLPVANVVLDVTWPETFALWENIQRWTKEHNHYNHKELINLVRENHVELCVVYNNDLQNNKTLQTMFSGHPKIFSNGTYDIYDFSQL